MRRVSKRRFLGALLLTVSAGLCGVASLARAAAGVDEATRATAREIGYEGVDAFQRGDYPQARERLDKAYAILQAPSLGLWSARALVKLGKLVEAHERYLEVTRLPTSVGDEAVQARARADATAEAAALAPRLPRLVVRVQRAPSLAARVTIDGAPLVAELWGESRPVDPGRHVVRAVAAGAAAEEEVELREGEHRTVVLKLAVGAGPETQLDRSPAPAAPPLAREPGATLPLPEAPKNDEPGARPPASMARRLGWIALATGGVGIAAGAITGGLVLARQNDLKCVNSSCPAAQNDVDRVNTLRVVSTVAFVAGAALAVTGGILLWRAPAPAGASHDAPAARALTLTILPGAAALRGHF